MSAIRTVTLELLRHGPPHNQLLSPLTEYLALCGNHEAVTVRMPFEHNQLKTRLNALRYKDSPETWRLQLQDTARLLADVLSEVPGLIAELSDSSGTPPPLTHLRLIQSAQELALVPFELASAPAAFPGTGQPLLLQPEAPLCITREVRRAGAQKLLWPRRPRILFAVAAPASVPPVPVEAHLLALRRALEPWVDTAPPPKGGLPRDIGRYLEVLPRASVESILAACRHGPEPFTHLHILAHGGRVPGEEERYGLVLHTEGEPDRPDVVEGDRLCHIVRTYMDRSDARLFLPTVVTIAACQGADQGSVVGIGSSIAHTLHTAGVPLVVASQFPLSYEGSVMLTEVLYEGLAASRDPRRLINDLRRQMRVLLPESHDWASVVVYASLPDDLVDQLRSIHVEHASRNFEKAVDYLDRVIGRNLKSKAGGPAAPRTDRALKAVEKHRKRFQKLLYELPPEKAAEKALLYQLLGKAYKWDAKLRFSARKPNQRERIRGSLAKLLREARRYYSLAFLLAPLEIYPLVQELSLAAVLEGRGVSSAAWWYERWATARTLGESLLLRPAQGAGVDAGERAEARSDLIELYLLGLLFTPAAEQSGVLEQALNHTRLFVAEQIETLSECAATYHQMKHYTDWYPHYTASLEVLKAPAEEILKILAPGLAV
jgi:hypothetical protein